MSARKIFFALTCLCAAAAFAAEPAKPAAAPAAAAPQSPPAPVVPKEFEPLKQLVGQWEGKTKVGDKEMPVNVTYELTSGGTAVIEKLFPGTPHEMVSIYTAEGSKVAMTHYCMLGNHPKMALKKADAKSMEFEMTGSEGLVKGPKEMHMHGLVLAFNDANHIKHEWISFDNGAKKESKVFELTRRK